MDTSEPQNTAKAAVIVFQKIRPQLIQYSSHPAKLREIIEPIFGFGWNRRAIGAIGSAPINDLVKIAKGPKAHQELIDRLRRILATSYFEESLIPSTGMGNLARLNNPIPHVGNHPIYRTG